MSEYPKVDVINSFSPTIPNGLNAPVPLTPERFTHWWPVRFSHFQGRVRFKSPRAQSR
jgi:hypothetical protein